MMEFIESTIAKENSQDESANWELKLNKDDLKVYLKKGGSSLDKNHPYMKA
jgi:hypothetical protein